MVITQKLKNLSDENEKWGRQLNTDPVYVAQNICSLIYDGITTTELDDFAASFSATLCVHDLVIVFFSSFIVLSLALIFPPF